MLLFSRSLTNIEISYIDIVKNDTEGEGERTRGRRDCISDFI
jgi:hypothetical protein